jgi:antitoxin Phd
VICLWRKVFGEVSNIEIYVQFQLVDILYIVLGDLYNSCMSKIIDDVEDLFEIDVPVSEARADLATLIDKTGKHPVRITSHGKVKAVLVNPTFYERAIEALEDLEDIRDIEASLKDKSPGIPWEDVKRDLGL